MSRVPDRFVPVREDSNPPSYRFHTNKEPHELSSAERLTRHQGSTPDPFRIRPRRNGTSDFRSISRSDSYEGTRAATTLRLHSGAGASVLEREVSVGAVWSVGGAPPPGSIAVDSGRGQLVGNGTNAPFYAASFLLAQPQVDQDGESHEGRLARALELGRTQRVLGTDKYSTFPQRRHTVAYRLGVPTTETAWNGTEWSNDGLAPDLQDCVPVLPSAAFRTLDAPGLRDDYYCTVMAYCSNCDVLAIGLADVLYGWSEANGPTLLNIGIRDQAWLTSIDFSSNDGKKSILAIGRSNGTIKLMSLLDGLLPQYTASHTRGSMPLPRFEAHHSVPISCLS